MNYDNIKLLIHFDWSEDLTYTLIPNQNKTRTDEDKWPEGIMNGSLAHFTHILC